LHQERAPGAEGKMMSKPKPPFPKQKQPMPGSEEAMDPNPDYGEESYKGSGKLKDIRTRVSAS
jgi:hypothetical protein